MKTLLKIRVLAAAVMFSISACSSCGEKLSDGSVEKVDTPKTTIDTTQKIIETAKKDSVKK